MTVWTFHIVIGIRDTTQQFKSVSAAAALVFIEWHHLLPIVRKESSGAPLFNSELPSTILARGVRRTMQAGRTNPRINRRTENVELDDADPLAGKIWQSFAPSTLLYAANIHEEA